MNFGSHDKAKFWNYELNTKTPGDYALNSHHKAWFTCNDCGHDFNKIIKNCKNSWCPFCHHLQLCNNNECKSCLINSFALHPKAIYWSDKNIVKPRDITKGTNKKYLFNCE